MLAQRLSALEADLQLLLAMQDLFLPGDDDLDDDPSVLVRPHQRKGPASALKLSSFPNDAPERDVSKRTKQKDKFTGSGPDHKLLPKRIQLPRDSQILTAVAHSPSTLNNTEKFTEDIPGTLVEAKSLTEKLMQDFEKEKQSFQQKIDEEKRLRAEAEESAKKIYVKLQKAEDELAREKQTKESLLLGTLQLKNLVQSFNTKLKETDKELNESKTNVDQLKSETRSLSKENTSLLKNLENFCGELGYRRIHSQQRDYFYADDGSDKKSPYFEFLRKKFQELMQKSVGREHDEVNKLASQLNNVVGRCAKLERERNEVLHELDRCRDREDHLKQKLNASEVSSSSLESEMLKKQIEHECLIKQLQSQIQIEKNQATLRISEYSSVIQRSKTLLISLKNERDDYRRKVKELSTAKHSLECKNKSLETEKQNLIHELEKLRRRLMDAEKEKMQLHEKSQEDIIKLESNLKKIDSEKRRCMELLSEMKNQLVSLKNKYEHDMAMGKIEMEKLKNENSRVDENFRVLQKVSEDQGQRIQKLRGDLESCKNINSKLESDLRDHECTESQLVRKLEQSESQCERYMKHIDQLQDKLEKFEEDVRQHDCDDFVDSRYKRKLTEVEQKLAVKSKDWEEALKQVDGEKSEAIATARKALQKIEEIKNSCNSQISQIKSQCQAELGQLMQRQQKTDEVRSNKIMELQSELDRIKNSSSQIQRALSTKIQQLQQALSICLGTGTGMNQTGNGNNNNSSLGLLESLHQLHQQNQICPSATTTIPSTTTAFGNVNVNSRFVGNNGFANNNAACGSTSNANANLLVNSSANGCSGHHNHQTQTVEATCFGNSNVNGCTSGVVNGDAYSTTTGALGLGGVNFIGSSLI